MSLVLVAPLMASAPTSVASAIPVHWPTPQSSSLLHSKTILPWPFHPLVLVSTRHTPPHMHDILPPARVASAFSY